MIPARPPRPGLPPEHARPGEAADPGPWTRVRFVFGKRDRLRFLGQLDLQRALERALRRSGLPARFTEGFHPRLRLSFPCASPTGMASSCEVVEIQVRAPCDPAAARAALGPELGEGLPLLDAAEVPPAERLRLLRAAYAVARRPAGPPVPAAALAELATRASLPAVRRGKEADLRPYLVAVGGDGERVRMEIAFLATGATARPEDFLALAGARPGDYLLERTGMRVELRNGAAVEERELGA